jgi:uncharacterized integral membrane protein
MAVVGLLLMMMIIIMIMINVKGKGKAVPLQAWNGPRGSRKVPRFHNGTGWW